MEKKVKIANASYMECNLCDKLKEQIRTIKKQLGASLPDAEKEKFRKNLENIRKDFDAHKDLARKGRHLYKKQEQECLGKSHMITFDGSRYFFLNN